MSQLGPSFKMGFLLFILVFGLSAASLYGGARLVHVDKVSSSGGDEVVPVGPVNVKILGKNILFDPRSFLASPGAAVTVTFDNQDAGVLHNIVFYSNRTKTAEIAKSEIKAGPAIDTLNFTAPSAPGAYPFICQVHPDTMTGVLNVR